MPLLKFLFTKFLRSKNKHFTFSFLAEELCFCSGVVPFGQALYFSKILGAVLDGCGVVFWSSWSLFSLVSSDDFLVPTSVSFCPHRASFSPLHIAFLPVQLSLFWQCCNCLGLLEHLRAEVPSQVAWTSEQLCLLWIHPNPRSRTFSSDPSGQDCHGSFLSYEKVVLFRLLCR